MLIHHTDRVIIKNIKNKSLGYFLKLFFMQGKNMKTIINTIGRILYRVLSKNFP